MGLKTLLFSKVPQTNPDSRTFHALGKRLGCTGQAVHYWVKRETLPVHLVVGLMNIPGHSFVLSDFRQYCKELDAILTLIESEGGCRK